MLGRFLVDGGLKWRLFFGSFGCGLAGFVNGCCRRDAWVLAMEREEKRIEKTKRLFTPSSFSPICILFHTTGMSNGHHVPLDKTMGKYLIIVEAFPQHGGLLFP